MHTVVTVLRCTDTREIMCTDRCWRTKSKAVLIENDWPSNLRFYCRNLKEAYGSDTFPDGQSCPQWDLTKDVSRMILYISDTTSFLGVRGTSVDELQQYLLSNISNAEKTLFQFEPGIVYYFVSKIPIFSRFYQVALIVIVTPTSSSISKRELKFRKQLRWTGRLWWRIISSPTFFCIDLSQEASKWYFSHVLIDATNASGTEP